MSAANWRELPEWRVKFSAAVQEGVTAYLLVVGAAMRAQLSKRGTGRIYRVGKGRKGARNARERGLHRASAPGKPPAANTGTLRRSWSIGRVGGMAGGPMNQSDGGSSPFAHVIPRNIYAVQIGYRYGSPLHYARIDGNYGRVGARPYIAPTIRAVSNLFEPTISQALARRL
jgi:hypothetical protein